MSEKPTEKPKTSGAESPTTRAELDFDDDAPDASTPATPSAPAPPAKDEAPPAKPPRPMSPKAQAEATLIEAFPSVDTQVVRAVLNASGGKLEPAFDALLGMSDPNFREEAPPKPPRPTAAQKQLHEDELLARQLAEHYQAQGQQSRARGGPQPYARSQQQPQRPEDRERNFFDDDLPEIGENIKKGFLETQKNVNKWITDFKKKIDGEDEDELDGRPPQRQNFGSSQSDQLYGIQRDAERRARQSGDRYDADPQIISDDFSTLRMQDNDPPAQPPRPGRPYANPDLFKPTPAPPQSGPVDEVEAADGLYSNPPGNRQPSPSGNKKKWQPLTSVTPNPEADDHDPFSLGDSEDEDSKAKDTRAEDTERLKKAAAGSPVSPIEGNKPIEAAERSGSLGTRNKEAEELLAKGSK